MKTFAILATLLGLSAAAPTPEPVEKRWPGGSNTLTPASISAYSIATGGLVYQPSTGQAYFDKTTTISTFNIPSGLVGKKCRLSFFVDSRDTTFYLDKSYANGVQVFSSLNIPPPYNVASWGPPGNQRNQHYGNLKIVKPGDATVDDYPRLLESFDCPAAGTYAWEVVAKWDVGVKWDPTLSGLYLKW